VLTIISTIFIPLNFIAGIYGMNFKYMPELAKSWGYPAALGLMAVVAGSLVVYFRRKGWFLKCPNVLALATALPLLQGSPARGPSPLSPLPTPPIPLPRERGTRLE